MSDTRNEHFDPVELAEFWTELKRAKDMRRGKAPITPASMLRRIMEAQHKSAEDVAEVTDVPVEQVTAFLAGDLRFTGSAVKRFAGWLGEDAVETLHGLQHLHDAFLLNNRQRTDAPLPKPDPRTVRLFAKRPAKLSHAHAQARQRSAAMQD
jgi:plasmid maintenance system antidote protein VapI